MDIAFSPCPNDTFIFYKWAHEPHVQATLKDVEWLNRAAQKSTYSVSKLSFFAWLGLKEQYQLLDCGAALGWGCGPLLITRRGEQLTEQSRVALPGEFTTAHLLYRLAYGDMGKRVFMPFDEIMEALATGRVDAGVIIHEGRFVYEQRGFVCQQDLGAWWEQQTQLPIPLGCIAVRRNLGKEAISLCEQQMSDSIAYAFSQPDQTMDYVRAHAQELDDTVMREHIATYVNAYTQELGDEGRAAIAEMERRAMKAGLCA